MKGRLNLFQASMLRWRDLHPYNAIHVVRIERPLEAARLRDAIAAELVRQQLTGFVLDVEGRRFEYRGGPARFDFRVAAGGTDPHAVVQVEVEREINAPFARDGAGEPFRFFAVDTGSAFHLGIAYDHVVADGESIVGLLKCIVDRHCDGRTSTAPPPERYPPTYGALLRRHAGAALRGMTSAAATARSLRHSVRPRFPRGRDPHNGVAALRIDSDDYTRFVATAKAWGMTRNDLLIAIVLSAVAPFVGDDRHRKRRNEIAVALIVNVRRDLGCDREPVFGQFLSSCRFSHAVPPGIDLRALARDVQRETERIKRRKLYLQTLVVLALGGLIWRFLSPTRRAAFHAKSYPVWIGITPLDVDALWRQAGDEPPRGYLRVVPTGPLAPLVVAATTDGSGLVLGLSFRTAAFSREDIARISEDIRARMATLSP